MQCAFLYTHTVLRTEKFRAAPRYLAFHRKGFFQPDYKCHWIIGPYVLEEFLPGRGCQLLKHWIEVTTLKETALRSSSKMSNDTGNLHTQPFWWPGSFWSVQLGLRAQLHNSQPCSSGRAEEVLFPHLENTLLLILRILPSRNGCSIHDSQ